MAFDEKLADRVRALVMATSGASEKKMFGGLCILVNGNMACGVVKDEMMVRVGPEAYEAALAKKHARPMDFTGRPLKGMVYVSAAGVKTKANLQRWIDAGVAYASAQPPKISAVPIGRAKKKATAKKKAPAKKRAPAKKKAPAKRKTPR